MGEDKKGRLTAGQKNHRLMDAILIEVDQSAIHVHWSTFFFSAHPDPTKWPCMLRHTKHIYIMVADDTVVFPLAPYKIVVENTTNPYAHTAAA